MAEVCESKQEPKSIKLPNTVEIFSNLKNAKRFAIDIGEFQLILSNFHRL